MNLKHILMIAQRNNSAFNCKPNEFHRKINIYSINAFQMKSFFKKTLFCDQSISHIYHMPCETQLIFIINLEFYLQASPFTLNMLRTPRYFNTRDTGFIRIAYVSRAHTMCAVVTIDSNAEQRSARNG